jgi:hypothetical protein
MRKLLDSKNIQELRTYKHCIKSENHKTLLCWRVYLSATVLYPARVWITEQVDVAVIP